MKLVLFRKYLSFFLCFFLVIFGFFNPQSPFPVKASTTLSLEKGNWDVVGLDSNNVSVGPAQALVLIRVKNTGTETANGVTATLNWTSSNSFINLNPNDSYSKALGDIAPGETANAFFLIDITRDSGAYNTSRNYKVIVGGANISGTPEITGSLEIKKIISQNRNQVLSILASNLTPAVGQTITVTILARTAATYDFLTVPFSYNPACLRPVSLRMTALDTSTSTSGILLLNAGGNIQLVATFLAVNPGTSTTFAFILDQSGNSYHYNGDYGEDVLIIEPHPLYSDLVVSKSVTPSQAYFGQSVEYVMKVFNAGPDNALSVSATEPFPNWLSWTSTFVSQGSYDQSSGVWTIGNLGAGETATLTINGTATSTGVFSNTLSATSITQDPSLNSNTVTSELEVVEAADLVVQKEVNDPAPFEGETVTITITVSNLGPNTATSVLVTDTIPEGLNFVAFFGTSTGTPNYLSGTREVIWDIGDLNSGSQVSLSFTATIAKGYPLITNTAEVSSSLFDQNSGNNKSTTALRPQIPYADLAITKTITPFQPSAGEPVLFLLTVYNAGPQGATNVVVTDTLPLGITWTSTQVSQGIWEFNEATNLWTWNVGNLGLYQTATATLEGTVQNGNGISNVAEVLGAEADPHPDDNTATASAPPTGSTADIYVEKGANKDSVYELYPVTFTLTIGNVGPNDAQDVVVTDTLPTHFFTDVSGVSIPQGTYEIQSLGGTPPSYRVVWNVGTLTAGTQLVATFTATANAEEYDNPYVNLVGISSATPDENPANNQAIFTLSVLEPVSDLVMRKTVPVSPVYSGQTIPIVLSMYNGGPDPVNEWAEITDTIPSGLRLDSWKLPDIGTVLPTIHATVIGETFTATMEGDHPNPILPPYQTLTITLYVTVTATDARVLENTSTCSSDEVDPYTDDNSCTLEIPVLPSADLAISKDLNNYFPNLGEEVMETITVTNYGPSDAQVAVRDILPSGLSFLSSQPTETSSSGSEVCWEFNLASGESRTITIHVLVTGIGEMENFASVSSDVFDPAPENNFIRRSLHGQPACFLRIEKGVDVGTASIGESVKFTVTVYNDGPSSTIVSVLDPLPSGLTYQSHLATTGTYVTNPSEPEEIWRVGNLDPGASATLTIVARVDQYGVHVNTATVFSDLNNLNSPNNQASASVIATSPSRLPSLSFWGLCLLGISLLWLGGYMLRRRKENLG
ncbi:MAG: hypothetical protein NUV68_08285 [Caldiserica bacterium]|jgi:uncharacterized repeat protein (TIGR01451 family)|nr:hypothetical protein [Caldisericota bacterium]